MSKVVPKAVNVSPKIAAEYLEKNLKNRPISRSTVNRYAEVMAQGRWVLNGEPIIIDEDGNLVDGQHRLQAVINSGQIVPMIVIHGVENKSFRTIDIGKKRTGADALSTYSSKYEKNRALIAAAAKLVYNLTSQGAFDNNRNRLDNDSLIDFVEKNKGIMRSVEFAITLQTARKIAPPSAMAALHYLFSKKDVDMAEKFFHKLNNGENIKAGEPIGALRTKLFILSQEVGVIRAREVIPYMVKTWELMRKGEPVDKLVVPKDYEVVII